MWVCSCTTGVPPPYTTLAEYPWYPVIAIESMLCLCELAPPVVLASAFEKRQCIGKRRPRFSVSNLNHVPISKLPDGGASNMAMAPTGTSSVQVSSLANTNSDIGRQVACWGRVSDYIVCVGTPGKTTSFQNTIGTHHSTSKPRKGMIMSQATPFSPRNQRTSWKKQICQDYCPARRRDAGKHHHNACGKTRILFNLFYDQEIPIRRQVAGGAYCP